MPHMAPRTRAQHWGFAMDRALSSRDPIMNPPTAGLLSAAAHALSFKPDTTGGCFSSLGSACTVLLLFKYMLCIWHQYTLSHQSRGLKFIWHSSPAAVMLRDALPWLQNEFTSTCQGLGLRASTLKVHCCPTASLLQVQGHWDRQAGTRQCELVWAVSVTGTRQTYCWIRILNDFSFFSPLPVFFFPCPRISPPSRKSLFISDKAMGHAVIVGLLSKNYCSSGSASLQTTPLHRLLPGLAARTAQPHHHHSQCPWHLWGSTGNRLSQKKLKPHPACQGYLIQ